MNKDGKNEKPFTESACNENNHELSRSPIRYANYKEL